MPSYLVTQFIAMKARRQSFRLWNGFTLINMNLQALAFAARRLNPNTNVQRYVIQNLKRVTLIITSNFIFNNLTCHFSSSVHDKECFVSA
ncbi:hypothetical protein T07_12265 [Trichinella nelsoni]|uniref:Uncharacterized protein n=1 Tax=Trichinella nelsoni TaxID=6336 RepID=A0A0V0RSQ7_9BILA|nr:hypothetical protein T07_12265 [Trichinella nelsoni]